MERNVTFGVPFAGHVDDCAGGVLRFRYELHCAHEQHRADDEGHDADSKRNSPLPEPSPIRAHALLLTRASPLVAPLPTTRLRIPADGYPMTPTTSVNTPTRPLSRTC
jgi:hypothetical protein